MIGEGLLLMGEGKTPCDAEWDQTEEQEAVVEGGEGDSQIHIRTF